MRWSIQVEFIQELCQALTRHACGMSECQSAQTGSQQCSEMRHIVLSPTPCYCLQPVTCIESVT